MRWIFLLLVLLNGVLYAWFFQEAQQREQAAARLQPDHTGLAPLVRLSEVPPGRLQPRVAEVPVPSQAAPSIEQQAPVEPKAPSLPPEVCYDVGVFADRAVADAFAESLSAVPAAAAVVQERRALAPDYRVHVQAPPSPPQLARLQRALKVDGLDSYVIQDGPLAGEVSVGLYRNKESAEALLSALLAKEYPAKMHLQARWEQVYKVSVRTAQPEQWGRFWESLDAERRAELKSEKKSCARVATEEAAE